MLPYFAILLVILNVFISLFANRYKFLVHVLSVALIFASRSYMALADFRSVAYYLVFGALTGEISFALSLIISKLSLRRSLPQLALSSRILGFIRHDKMIALEHVLVAGREELLWRCTIQSVLGNSLGALMITTIGFFLTHIDMKEKDVYIAHYIDLFVFSLLLGLLYYFFSSFYLVCAVHCVRNLNILNVRSSKGLLHDSNA